MFFISFSNFHYNQNREIAPNSPFGISVDDTWLGCTGWLYCLTKLSFKSNFPRRLVNKLSQFSGQHITLFELFHIKAGCNLSTLLRFSKKRFSRSPLQKKFLGWRGRLHSINRYRPVAISNFLLLHQKLPRSRGTFWNIMLIFVSRLVNKRAATIAAFFFILTCEQIHASPHFNDQCSTKSGRLCLYYMISTAK